jgi:hypothetical protein
LEHLQEYWRRLANCVRDLYTELDGGVKDLAIWILNLHFPTHPVITNTNTLAHYHTAEVSMRCGVPYKDLSDYFPKDCTLPAWPTIQHLSYDGKEHRISTALFQKLANACPNLVSWSVEADEMERRCPELVLESREGTVS